MKRVLLVVLVLLAVLCVVVGYAAPTKVTNSATMTYTDADGKAYTVDSNAVEIAVLARPKVVAPSSVIRGVSAAITVTCDVGGPEWTYRVTLPTWGGTIVPDSLVITGGTGGLSGVSVWLDPLPAPGEVTIGYRVIW